MRRSLGDPRDVFRSRRQRCWHIEGLCDIQRTIDAATVVRHKDPSVNDRRPYWCRRCFREMRAMEAMRDVRP